MTFRNTITSFGEWVRGIFAEADGPTDEYDEKYLEYLDYKYIQTPPNRDDGNCRCNICGALFDDMQETIDHVGGHDGTGSGEIDPFEGRKMLPPLSGRDESPDPIASAVAEETAAHAGRVVETSPSGLTQPDFDLPDECPECGFEPDDPPEGLIDEETIENQPELLDADPDSHWQLTTETPDSSTTQHIICCPRCDLEVVKETKSSAVRTIPGGK